MIDDKTEEGNEDFAKMLEEQDKKNEHERVVDGIIVDIDANWVHIDVGQKIEGKINLSDITIDGELQFKKGDKIAVMMSQGNAERPILSYKKVISKQKFSEFFAKHGSEPEDLIIDAKIISVKRGAGFVMQDKEGTEFFMPMREGYLKSEGAVGKNIRAKVLKVDEERNSIIVSRKALVEERKAKREEIIEKITNDDSPILGTVQKVTNYGLFIDIGGIDGLCNFREISHKGPVKPSDYYEQGDEVQVAVINYDKEKGQIALSIKKCLPDPWLEVQNELEVGDTIGVTVSNFETYGAFVDLGNDIEGLLHISEISWDKHLKTPQEVLELGQEIEVEVLELNVPQKRLRVSLKSLTEKPFVSFASSCKIGDIVKGKIVSITDFGLFVNIAQGVDGLIHNEGLSWDRNEDIKSNFKKGDEIEAKVVKIDRDRQNISLSVKALVDSPMQNFTKDIKVGSIVKGKVKHIKDFGIFVELADGVDALIRTEDLGPFQKDELEVDTEVEAVVVQIDHEKSKIRLSIKKLEYQRERDLLKSVNEDEPSTFGDILKDKFKK
ncbi:MAG: 30S ribosomal protein S1 [Campylobacteraceae bacterium 4484_166]|nr:MAG: 30S ribosomal protein S1 [Campylobacteraceae bacterium 4484_166]